MNLFQPAERKYSIADLEEILRDRKALYLSEKTKEVIKANSTFLREKIKESAQPIYGVNTGFGSLCQVAIQENDLKKLQKNLIMSHACGTGHMIDKEIVRIILLLKIMSLSKGYSGVRLELVQLLLDFYNRDILPVIYEQGSLGASGDLAPLAHMSLPVLGLGKVHYQGKVVSSFEALKSEGLAPIELEAKEGLALINGTQFSTAFALLALMEAKRQLDLADDCAALSLDVFLGSIAPFLPPSHLIRPHKGQMAVAENIRFRLEGSELMSEKKEYVQDPYSFRCVPQVHGATRDAIAFAIQTIETEINSVTDNPNIFSEEDLILSAGNFHAQPVAYACDLIAIAMAEIGNISERRIFQLISGSRGLPPFLVHEPGIHSGLMIAQYTAASIVSQNKMYAIPASIDSIVSSAGQEDHVSMAANAGTKLYRLIENLWTILAIEWMCASQALAFRRPKKTSHYLEKKIECYRKSVPVLLEDRVINEDIELTKKFLIHNTENVKFSANI